MAEEALVRRLSAILGGLAVTVGLVTFAPPAHAGCGQWWPGHGSVQAQSTRGSIEDDHVDVLVLFEFSESQLSALRCTGDIGIEIDAIIDGIVAGSGGVQAWSDLPGAYLDTEFMDNSDYRNLGIGTVEVQSLQAGRTYTTHVRVVNPEREASEMAVYLNFQRSHWARWWDVREWPACDGTPAWCAFASEIVRMQDQGLSAVTVPMADDSVSVVTDGW
jgi:hypothetical protein